MNLRHATLAWATVAALYFLPAAVEAQTPEARTVANAIGVFQGFTEFRATAIPESMLADAQAIAIVPNVVKAGFILAGRFGHGVLLIRGTDGLWRAPTFVTFTGGSVGWQAGLQSTDVVLVFKNRTGLDTMLRGREFTLGADASIAAGPVGRQAAAGTDVKLSAEIYSYSRSRGLFAGVALDGSVLKVNNLATQSYYANGTVLPAAAQQLVELVSAASPMTRAPTVDPASTTDAGPLVPFSGTQSTVPPSEVPAVLPVVPTVEQLRASLAASSDRLNPLLDASWQKFLALPQQVRKEGASPTCAELTAALNHYDRVVQDARYEALAKQAEFHETYDLLRRYAAAVSAAAAAKTASANGLQNLPPPPL